MASMTNKEWERLKKLYLLHVSYTASRGVRYIISSEAEARIGVKLRDELCSVYKSCANGGFKPGEICSIHEACDALIFVYNPEVMKAIIKETAQAAAVPAWGQVVGSTWSGYDDSVRVAKSRLSEAVIKNIREGYETFDAVLYGVRESAKYNLTAIVGGAKTLIEYPNFNLPHAAVSQVNNEYLIPRGFRVSGVSYKGVIPANQGVLVSVRCETLRDDPL